MSKIRCPTPFTGIATATLASLGNELSWLSASEPLVLEPELAGHGNIVLAEIDTVMMAAAKVAANAVEVASLFVRVEGFAIERSVALDHMALC